MEHLPIFLDLRGRRCLVAGAGPVGVRKARLLLGAGARVEVVAPRAAPELASLEPRARLRHLARAFEPADLDGCALAIAATGDRAVNRALAAAAGARGVPVNVVDDPLLCTFLMPSIVDRSPLVVAIGSGGASPVLVRLVRARIEGLLAPRLGRLAALAGQFREQVKASGMGTSERRRFWERVLDGPIAELVYAGRDEQARRALSAALGGGGAAGGKELWVLAGGAGEPDLLTLRALRVLQQADLVLCEEGVEEGVAALARRDAERRAVVPGGEAAALERALERGERVAWICASQPGAGLIEAIDRARRRGVAVERLG